MPLIGVGVNFFRVVFGCICECSCVFFTLIATMFVFKVLGIANADQVWVVDFSFVCVSVVPRRRAPIVCLIFVPVFFWIAQEREGERERERERYI